MDRLILRIKNLFKMTRKIGVRLRLVFVLLGVVIAVSGITAILQTKTILQAHSKLTHSALPMLTVAQRTERNLNAVFLVLENLDSYQTVGALENAQVELKTKTEKVRENLVTLWHVDTSGQVIADLQQRLDIAGASSHRVLHEKSELLGVQEDIQSALAQVSQLQEQAHELLDNFAFDFTNKMERLVRASETEGQMTENVRLKQIDALFVASLNVNTIGFGIEDVIALTRNQAQTNRHLDSARARAQIDAKLSDIINRLTYLPNIPARRDLAKYIATLRDIVSKDAGIFARLHLEQAFQEELATNRTTHLRLIAEVSAMSNALVSRTLLMVDTTSAQLSAAVYQLIWVILIAFLTLSITVAMTNQVVINKQFSQRMEVLNQSVSAISKGDLDHDISVSGSDELGDMARALAIFRGNAEDLQRSNVELEKFAYVAAHDLRSPLIAIHDLSIWTFEDDESVLSNQSQEYLKLLQQRVVRLKRLLNDLLSYARVGQSEPGAEIVNLAHLVQEHASCADPEDHYHIRYLGCPLHIMIQLTPIQQILGNLLNNAVKHHDKSQGSITVSAKAEIGLLTLTISDDGAGIEKQYHRRVFELFQTLRPRDEVEGSGLGLAIVEKLVTRQKGRIEMVSNPKIQRGTSFIITLPLLHDLPLSMKPSDVAAA